MYSEFYCQRRLARIGVKQVYGYFNSCYGTIITHRNPKQLVRMLFLLVTIIWFKIMSAYIIPITFSEAYLVIVQCSFGKPWLLESMWILL